MLLSIGQRGLCLHSLLVDDDSAVERDGSLTSVETVEEGNSVLLVLLCLWEVFKAGVEAPRIRFL